MGIVPSLSGEMVNLEVSMDGELEGYLDDGADDGRAALIVYATDQ